jgi:hypothetical protein
MTEINNNIHIVPISSNINKISDVSPKTDTSINEQAVRELPADTGILGKSQVSKPDNVQSDIDFCLKQTPEFLEKCDNFFEKTFIALSNSNDDFAYEKACVLTKEFANEFS